MLLGFECAINPNYFMKIVKANFKKISILYFYLSELPLMLRVGRKTKTAKKYLQENSRYHI